MQQRWLSATACDSSIRNTGAMTDVGSWIVLSLIHAQHTSCTLYLLSLPVLWQTDKHYAWYVSGNLLQH